MSDRLQSAVTELIAALKAEFASPEPRPTRLLSIDEAAAELGIGRSRLYLLIQNGELRTLKVGRRRLVPESALTEYIASL